MLRLIFFSASLLFLTFCKKENPDRKHYVLPEFQCPAAISVTEDDPARNASLTISTSGLVGKDVTVYYRTTDSTAVSGLNYLNVPSGQLQIPAGSTNGQIVIPIYSDTLQKHDLVFKIHIDSTSNGLLSNSTILVNIVNTDYSQLVWSDEFNDTAINTANWNFEKGNNGGWGNNELEVYTDSRANSYISDGSLVIKAISSSGSYTSARMTSQNKQSFTTGRIDIRAKLPKGKGIWPALWMLGTNISNVSWPKCGEIDIMEMLGDNVGKIYGTVHYDNNGHQSSGLNSVLQSGTFSDTYHIFSILWKPHHLTWLLDNKEYYTVSDRQTVGFRYDLPQFFIFNVAVGGNWPGNPDNTTEFPQTMEVDYIRVYQ